MRPELPAYGAASGSLRIDAEPFAAVLARVTPANRSAVRAARSGVKRTVWLGNSPARHWCPAGMPVGLDVVRSLRPAPSAMRRSTNAVRFGLRTIATTLVRSDALRPPEADYLAL
jgi:hypothetical protein